MSRGGVKLAAALDHFGLDVAGRVCLDVGASTGGFTEVLLARGAKRVYAIDVGTGQLHPRLRGRDDIVSIEQTDIRKLDPARLPEPPDFATVDVSFISLKLVLPAIGNLLTPRAQILALIKPQFETKGDGVKKGIVRDETVRKSVCDDVAAFLASLGWRTGLRRCVGDPRRRRQPGIFHRGRTWLSTLRSMRSAIAATASRTAPTVRSMCRARCRARRVEVEDWPGHPDRRQLLAVEKPSPERIAPICPHFGVCGGCALQHWATAPYRAWKRGLVVEALRQADIDAPVAELIDAHGDGRRRAVFHARRSTHDVLEVGFSAARAHHVVAIDRCPILAKGLGGALTAAWAIAERLGAMAKPLDIGVTATDTGLDVDVRGSGPLSARATRRWRASLRSKTWRA